MKREIFIIVCCLLTITAYAKKRQHYLPFGLGYAYHHVRDDGMSPLLYKGSSLAFKTGYVAKSEKNRNSLQVLFHYGKPHTRNFNITETTKTPLYRLELNYTFLRQVKKFGHDKYKLLFGGRSEFHTSIRVNPKLGNSSLNYEILASLGPSLGLSRTFDIKERKIAIDFLFNLPIVSFVMRPNYVTIVDFTNPDLNVVEDHLQRGKFVTLNKFTRTTFEIDASYVLKNGNQISLRYYWDFYSYRNVNKVKAAVQGIVLSTVFKF